ncbi:MAG TPA: nicotinate (nicotinamide) nucleotide adenylyltransferase [Kamptonema sp.]|nr:nicotinate (nicotinamide) nucleotide adenylyltransferase [Kamptonema sp.]
MEKMAIFGGTFDPVHWGHLLMAETAMSQFGLDQAIWIPDPSPPHKLRRVWAGWEQRREMVSRAIGDRHDCLLAPQQEHPTHISYAIETFLYLQQLHPNTQWYWIIGSDAFQTLPQWHRCQEIGKFCHWLVAPRPWLGESGSGEGDRQETLFDTTEVVTKMAFLGVQIRSSVLEMPRIGISSSLIRRYCLENRSIRYLVPEPVRTYITAQKLYQAQPDA